MSHLRLAFFSLLISLPAVLLISVGAVLVGLNVPKAIRNEPSRIGRDYRDVAADLIAHPEKAPSAGERKAGWRQVSKIDGTPWGYSVCGEKATVWFKSGERQWRWLEMEAIRPFPYALVFYWGGGLAAALVLALTLFALDCFRRFTKERDDFLAATAHDLTTPLVGMRYMIGRDDEELRRLNERMLLLVNNIKDFLRLGGKRRRPDRQPFDLLKATHEAYQLFRVDYEDSECGGVAFDKSALSGESAAVCGDETMTMQILWNLFGNDLKYAAPYGKVGVSFSRNDGQVVVQFADEGPGMTSAQMRHAFDRYYRAKTVLDSGKGGFGIGLCTAHELAVAMGGSLCVRANEPKGCVFELRLPAAAENRPQA